MQRSQLLIAVELFLTYLISSPRAYYLNGVFLELFLQIADAGLVLLMPLIRHLNRVVCGQLASRKRVYD